MLNILNAISINISIVIMVRIVVSISTTTARSRVGRGNFSQQAIRVTIRLSSQNNHIEELIIGFVKVVVDKANDDDMREENEIGEEAENGKSHGLIVDQMSQLREDKNEGVRQVTDEVVYEHENNHVGQVLIRFFFTVIFRKSKIYNIEVSFTNWCYVMLYLPSKFVDLFLRRLPCIFRLFFMYFRNRIMVRMFMIELTKRRMRLRKADWSIRIVFPVLLLPNSFLVSTQPPSRLGSLQIDSVNSAGKQNRIEKTIHINRIHLNFSHFPPLFLKYPFVTSKYLSLVNLISQLLVQQY